MRHGRWVDAIQLHFVDGGKTASLGSTGGTETVWRPPADERIVQVDVWTGKFVDAVQFTSSSGAKSPKLGGSGGKHHTCAAVDPQHGLVGLTGACGWYLDAVGFRFARVTDTKRGGGGGGGGGG